MRSLQLNFLARELLELQATALSWVAEAGSLLEDRKILDGHAARGDRMPLEYSWSVFAGPLARLETVTEATKKGQCDLGATRSGRCKVPRSEQA